MVHDGRLFVTSVSNKIDRMKNILKDPAVEVTLDGFHKRMRSEAVNSEGMRKVIEKLYRKKYRFSSRLLRLARRGSLVFELKR